MVDADEDVESIRDFPCVDCDDAVGTWLGMVEPACGDGIERFFEGGNEAELIYFDNVREGIARKWRTLGGIAAGIGDDIVARQRPLIRVCDSNGKGEIRGDRLPTQIRSKLFFERFIEEPGGIRKFDAFCGSDLSDESRIIEEPVTIVKPMIDPVAEVFGQV